MCVELFLTTGVSQSSRHKPLKIRSNMIVIYHLKFKTLNTKIKIHQRLRTKLHIYIYSLNY